MSDYAARLHEAVAAVCPITGVRCTGSAVTDTFFPLASATPSQLTAAQNVINTFDRSDAAQATWLNGNERTMAVGLLADPQESMKALRSLVLIALDEINLLRERLTAQDNAVATATSLANLQSQWAAIASAQPMPDRTAQQLRTAMTNKINNGSADN